MVFAEEYAAQQGLCVSKPVMVEKAQPIWMVSEVYLILLQFSTFLNWNNSFDLFRGHFNYIAKCKFYHKMFSPNFMHFYAILLWCHSK